MFQLWTTLGKRKFKAGLIIPLTLWTGTGLDFMLLLYVFHLRFSESKMGVVRSGKAAEDTGEQRQHWTDQGQCLFFPLRCQHCSGISGAELRCKFRLYLPVCQSLPVRDYLCYPKLMQDLENAGFKLFTQMHWGQQKGWKKYQRAGCCTVKHWSYGEIWNSLFLSSKWRPVLVFPLSLFGWQHSGFFY